MYPSYTEVQKTTWNHLHLLTHRFMPWVNLTSLHPWWIKCYFFHIRGISFIFIRSLPSSRIFIVEILQPQPFNKFHSLNDQQKLEENTVCRVSKLNNKPKPFLCWKIFVSSNLPPPPVGTFGRECLSIQLFTNEIKDSTGIRNIQTSSTTKRIAKRPGATNRIRLRKLVGEGWSTYSCACFWEARMMMPGLWSWGVALEPYNA